MTVLILNLQQLFLTRKQAAEMLGIRVRKLNQLAERGDLELRRTATEEDANDHDA
ncbi:MAG: hypothetical protein ACLGSD_17320 [Acidobacteriota bacterium]